MKMTYAQAINKALIDEMEQDDSIFVYGIDVADPKAIFGTTKDLATKFGASRCFSTPLSEDAMTGFGLGSAINGLRPVHIHMRVDFAMLAMNQLVNLVSSMHYGSNGQINVPIFIRLIAGRGWGQGYQHSKTLHSFFAHIPGLKVICPTTVQDAYDFTRWGIRDNNPVISIEHRWLYYQEDESNTEDYNARILMLTPRILRKGKDLTIVSTSWMNVEAKCAADILAKYHDIEVELIDLPILSPIPNLSEIYSSVHRTHNCIVADNDWINYGASAEIATQIYNNCYMSLKQPIERIGFEHIPCPTARHLENKYYQNAETIVRRAEKILGLDPCTINPDDLYSYEHKFKGPF